jgi:hypothetical protein
MIQWISASNSEVGMGVVVVSQRKHSGFNPLPTYLSSFSYHDLRASPILLLELFYRFANALRRVSCFFVRDPFRLETIIISSPAQPHYVSVQSRTLELSPEI